jgi:Domain of unknown function (DUF4157)
MNWRSTTQTKISSFSPIQTGPLQRKCNSCGQHKIASGECTNCQPQSGLQRKLTIGATNDPLELEADRVADQVLATRSASNSTISATSPRIQRFTGQTNGQADMEAPASVDRVLSSPGRPLDPALQQDMGQRFGHDFSRVRVHTGAAAERSAQEVNANAYTVGHNIVFGTNRFSPMTTEGRRLLAHELTHTIQQDSTALAFSAKFAVKGNDDTLKNESDAVAASITVLEQEADHASDAVISPQGGSVARLLQLQTATPIIHRQPTSSAPTTQEHREMQLRQMAIYPGRVLQQWQKLKQNERDTVLWEIIRRYDPDFATDFLNYARGKKKPNFTIQVSNSPEFTPQTLMTRGYHYAGNPGGISIWVHPSGREIHLLTLPQKPESDLPPQGDITPPGGYESQLPDIDILPPGIDDSSP